jgi:2'-5' RNA ligase
MFAIASLLDTSSDLRTRELWDYLLGQCGLLGIYSTPTPHVTWQVAESYPEEINDQLERLAKNLAPFYVRVAGLGIFTGNKPVIHLSLVKTSQMMIFHQMIWTVLSRFASSLNEYYSPVRWMPHITIAYRDLTSEKMICALENLAFQTLETEMLVDNISLIYSFESNNGLVARFELEGKKRKTI